MPSPSKKPIGPVKIDTKMIQTINQGEDTLILAAAKAYVEADVHVQPGTMVFNIAKREGSFARVTVTANEGGSYYVMLKLVNQLWMPVAAGQDLPGKAAAEKYGLPEGWYSKEY